MPNRDLLGVELGTYGDLMGDGSFVPFWDKGTDRFLCSRKYQKKSTERQVLAQNRTCDRPLTILVPDDTTKNEVLLELKPLSAT